MSLISVFPLFNKRALVTRESARELKEILQPLVMREDGEIVLDFTGVDAVTPSFVDELLGVTEELQLQRSGSRTMLRFLNLPTRMSEKFAAIGRAREVELVETNGSWEVYATQESRISPNP